MEPLRKALVWCGLRANDVTKNGRNAEGTTAELRLQPLFNAQGFGPNPGILAPFALPFRKLLYQQNGSWKESGGANDGENPTANPYPFIRKNGLNVH